MPTDRVRALPAALLAFLVCVCSGMLAACGGGGGSPGDPDSPIKLQAVSTGSLAVAIRDLPEGAGGAVHVSGPANYAAELDASRTLDDLAPGDYTVSALPVVAGPATWIPTPPAQTVNVRAGDTATAEVRYAEAPLAPH
jgi:hypothetical protein